MPVLASTSRVQLAYILESVFGVTPGAGNGSYLRATGESFDYNITKEMSKELRADRSISSVVPVAAQGSGGFNFHLNYGEYDPFLASLLQSAYVVYGTAGEQAAASSVTFTTTTMTAGVATAGADSWATLALGQFFRFNSVGLNAGKVFRVSTSVAPTTTVITLDVSTPAVVSAAESGKVQTSRLANGVTQTSFTLEKQMADVTQVLTYKGMTPSKLSLKIASGSLTDGSFDFVGKSGVRGTVTALPGTLVASKTYDIHNGATGVGLLWEAGAPLTSTFIKSLTIDYDNALRPQQAIANLPLVGVGSGTIAVKGSIEAYFADGALYDKFLSNAYTALTVSSVDASGNGYVFTMPRVSLMNSKITASAKDQDLMATFDYMALSDDSNAVAGLRKTLIIDRIGAALP